MRVNSVLIAGSAGLLAIAGVVSGRGVLTVFRLYEESPMTFLVALHLQLAFGLVLVVAVTVILSLAAMAFRWLSGAVVWSPAVGGWRRLITVDGLAAGMVAVGVWLGWTHTDVYPDPDGVREVTVRTLSRIEAPLGLGPASRGLAPVVVVYRGADVRTVVGTDYEFDDLPLTERARGRVVRWGEGEDRRAIVAFPDTGFCHFFSDSMDEEGQCPEENVQAEFLDGAPWSAVRGSLVAMGP